MKKPPTVVRPREAAEFPTDERCFILESWNQPADEAVSIARARVRPGTTTQLHRLNGVVERYVILSGRGVAQVGQVTGIVLEPGDVLHIPAGDAQRIRAEGTEDLVFLCVCNPRFVPDCYEALE